MLAPTFLLSLTVHEYAHARTALAFGDPTAKHAGRVTLNPLAHLDPIGTLVLLVTHMIGWAKPVPVNPANLNPPRLGDIMVSLAGPMSNLGLAAVCALLLRALAATGLTAHERFWTTADMVLTYTFVVNVCLCAFNLIPLFPLDGHHVIREILPTESRIGFMRWQVRFGAPVLLGLIFGPRLLSMVTGGRVPDPIGMWFHWWIRTAVRLLPGVG